MFVHTRSNATKSQVCQVWMPNSNALSQKSGNSDCQTRVRQTIDLYHFCRNETNIGILGASWRLRNLLDAKLLGWASVWVGISLVTNQFGYEVS